LSRGSLASRNLGAFHAVGCHRRRRRAEPPRLALGAVRATAAGPTPPGVPRAAGRRAIAGGSEPSLPHAAFICPSAAPTSRTVLTERRHTRAAPASHRGRPFSCCAMTSALSSPET